MASQAIQAVGAPWQAMGQITEGQQTASAMMTRANIMRQNAQQARDAAAFNANRQDLMAQRALGSMTNRYAASGVDLNSGSVAAVLGASTSNAELDRQNIIRGGNIRALSFENQASMEDKAASNAINGAYWNAFGTMFLGGTKMFSGSGGNLGGGGGSYETDYSASDSLGQGETVEDAGYEDGSGVEAIA